ncbi:hypothetical protein BC826DRAFT_1043513 [Russula brevipes]|nr:hypothetical protein BC826DRAFT_1043513 [Russula brevipes]
MPRSATRREDWVLLLDTPDGWAPPSPTAAPRQPSIRRSRPDPEPISPRAAAHPDARATTRVPAPNPMQTTRLPQ